MAQDLIIAQLSDSHLFANKTELFHGHNVYQNLLCILKAIQSDHIVDGIVFTGDLTQDHSQASYQNFVEAVQQANVTKPIYYIAGNHDDNNMLLSEFKGKPFNCAKSIESDHWTLHLLNSQTDTPAGRISSQTLSGLNTTREHPRHQFLFMHHNPVDVGYFIDEHGLKNQDEFWDVAKDMTHLKGIACGHVHRELTIPAKQYNNSVTVYTCPATSIQFDPMVDGVSALDERPGYRRFIFFASGDIQTTVTRI